MSKQSRGKAPNNNPQSRTGQTEDYLEAFVYFVGWRVVFGRRRENLRSMIMTVPGPIRDSSSLSKIEAMILDDEVKLDQQKKAAGIRMIGQDDDISVQITNISFLEKYLQKLTPEEVEVIRARNAKVLEDMKKREASTLATSKDDPAGTPN